MTLTKAELIDAVYEKVGFSKKEAADLVELVFESMKEELCKGGSIKISGFGKFRVRGKKARMGRNPQTGEAMVISARKVLTFTPSRILRDGINGKSTMLPSAAVEGGADDEDVEDDETGT
jgi:integration host factor subunit alpha